jgi:phosphonate dehydrogenase
MPNPLRIVISNWVHDEVIARLRSVGEVDANRERVPWSASELVRRSAEADALLAFMPDRVDAEFLRQCPRLKVIACALKGFDNFDVDACTGAGVWVTIAPDLLTNPTAELAVGLTIALARKLREGDALMRSGTFEGWRPVLYGKGLDQSVVGIVGMGAVGRAIAARLAGFGCRILGVDPGRDMPDGITAADLDVALTTSDYLILAVPLTPSTFHLIGREALKRLKADTLLIHIGRGSVVDEAAVADALDAGALGGYAADVYEMEDWALESRPRAIDPRLLAHPATVFTPHLGSAVDRVRLDIAIQAADDIAAVLAGRRPRYAINEPSRGRTSLVS